MTISREDMLRQKAVADRLRELGASEETLQEIRSASFKRGHFILSDKTSKRIAEELGGTVKQAGGRKFRYSVVEIEGQPLGPDFTTPRVHAVKKAAKEIAETSFRFDAKLPDAVRVAKRQAAKMVTEISRETEKNIRNLIAMAIDEGLSPQDAARAIKETIGLTSAQGQAAMKYRQELLDSGLTLDKVESAFERYTEKLLNQRAETVARTEIMDALNEGKSEAFQQAQEEGYLSANATEELICDPDACEEICKPMEGMTVPLGGEWPEGRPPFHPRCRCTTVVGSA